MRADHPRVRVVVGGTLLVLCWLAPPVRLQRAGAPATSDACVMLADRPPTGGASALPILERCAALVPDDGELLTDLASTYEAVGRFADAETVYRRALAEDPFHGDLHVALARRLQARGAFEEARSHAQAALRLQPNRRAVLHLVADLNRAALEHGESRRR